jgi:hypothetical protein
MMHQKLSYFLYFILLSAKGYTQENPIVLTGSTVIDVSNFGNRSNDITDAVVVIQGGKIIKAGSKGLVKFPSNAKVIDVTGKYIIPGLIDGFSVLNNQGQANAHLYMGVTTVACSEDRDERRGPLFLNANPSPRIKRTFAIPDDILEETLEDQKTLQEADIQRISEQIDKLDFLQKNGITSIFLHHRFPPQLMKKLIEKANTLQLNTIGELDLTPYKQALNSRVNSLVHTSRYLLGAMPDSISIPYMRDPQNPIAGDMFMNFMFKFSIENDRGFAEFAKSIAASQTALMPTLSLLYSSLPDHKNLWKEPAAVCLDPNDIWLPMDTETGKSTSFLSAKYAMRQIDIEKGFVKFGAYYLTGSGADAFGALPGISEHIEILMLHQIGLSPRQALAAATNNFSIFNGWKDIGLIEEGRTADLLVLSANPLENLENLRNIEMVWLGGKLIDRTTLLKK